MLVLYTEEQLYRAYKVYLRDYCITNAMPDLDTFRVMFEENEKIQQLAEREIHEH